MGSFLKRSAGALALLAGVAGAQDKLAASLPLIPIPREVRAGASVPLAHGVRLVCTCSDPADAFTIDDLKAALSSRAIPATGTFSVTFKRVQSLPPEMQEEGYTIDPGANGLVVSAASAAGIFYGAQTFKQLISGNGTAAVVHLASIRDWPAMRYRGVSDDLSRGPVPTLAFQERLIRTLAQYKVNLYSPYFEHTQQYASNPLPAPPGGSLTAEDARALTAYGTRYHITVVPEQEAFGHLHHNLTWEQYQPLAETPHGAVLAPGQPGSLLLIKQMFGELAALYPSPFLHIGADETVDLGTGQTKADVEARTLGPVYLDFLQNITSALAPLHRKLLFWGDIAESVNKSDPNLLKALPASFKQSTIAIPWWYTPHPPHGFAALVSPFTAAGFETWVAPGINNWSVVYPDWNDGLTNIQQFVAEGQRQHSTGELNTTWYDDGEALASSNWYGLLFGAAAGWQSGTSSIPEFQQSFGQVFHGDATGYLNEAQIELMTCHTLLREQAHVGDGSDGLFWLDPWSKDGQTYAAKLRPYTHDLRLHAERALTLIAEARAAAPPMQPSTAVNTAYDPANAFPSNPTSLRHPGAIDALELGARRMDFIGLKFQLADEIVQGYARAVIASSSTDKTLHATTVPELSEINGVNGRMEDVRDTYSLLRDLYAQTWLRTNRAYGLRPVLEHYDESIQMWQARSDRFRSAQRQYTATRTLPSAPELGLPTTP